MAKEVADYEVGYDNCSCEDWAIGIKQLNSILALSSLRSSSPKYTGPFFRFCPWCAKPLPPKES